MGHKCETDAPKPHHPNKEFDLEQAKSSSHQSLSKTLVQISDVYTIEHISALTDDSLCYIGKWIHREGQAFQHLKSFQILQQLHEQFHELINLVIELHNQGDHDRKLLYLENLTNLSALLIEHLDYFHQELQQSPHRF